MELSIQNKQNAFNSIRTQVCERLAGLAEDLTYHNLDHTLDVVRQSERLAYEEGIRDEYKIYLLKIAALYHDTGFLNTYSEHEKASCEIFLQDSANYNLSEEDRAFVMRLIMATKLPQTPQDIFECIICDADLDYLGRPDFFKIGDGLRKEFIHYGIVSSDGEWETLQIKFLTSHYYHTNSSKISREAVKQVHIAQLS